MSVLSVRLFGRPSFQRGELTVSGIESRKVQELFCYLLISRNRPHPREALASLLWSDRTTAVSKKYLRQSLWQLQSAINPLKEPTSRQVLTVDDDWVEINAEADLWLDVAAFERAFAEVVAAMPAVLNADSAQTLKNAVELYQGDLLEGWYQDWCLYERERLQNMYLGILERLVEYCESHHEYQAGQIYGSRILAVERAHERTHRRLMRLHYLAGDRTTALRQYKRCVATLEEDLGVEPSMSTRILYEQICNDRLDGRPPMSGSGEHPVAKPANATPETHNGPLVELLEHLKKLRTGLIDIERQMQEDIRTVELTLRQRS